VVTGRVPGTFRARRTLIGQELVSIIIPTRASRGLVRTCIETLRRITTYRNFEIICIDNIPADQENWKQWLRANADKVFHLAEPFNWSRFNNRAVEYAAGKFLLFLNDDIEIIEPDWLHALLENVQRPEVGSVGPMLLWPDRTVQSAGLFLTADVGRGRHAFRNLPENDPGYFGLALTQRNVIGVLGACLLTRREVFEMLGGFDEGHSMVNNELDYCLKVWREGLLTVFTPYAKLIHHERATRADMPDTYDAAAFEEQWRGVYAEGDPYHHPLLSKEFDCFTPEPEPLRAIRAGGPLLRRDAVRRILLVKLDHIGDCIIALPAIRRLKEAFPDASLRVLAGGWTRPIWSLAEVTDEVIEFDFFHAQSDRGVRELKEAELQSLRRRLMPYHFDLAIDLRRHPDTRHVLQYTGARFLAGFDVQGQYPWLDIALDSGGDAARVQKRQHVSADLINLVNAVDESCEPAPTGIFPPSPSSVPLLPEPIERLLFSRPVVCVHPAAGDTMRQWPAHYFAELIDLLVDRDRVTVALIGASTDKEVAAQVLRSVRQRWAVVDLVGELKLADLPHFMLRCALFVGNNSGPHHLAAGLGVPTIGIHSAIIDSREWAPIGPYAIALRREMECGPCYIGDPVQCHRNVACLTALRPGEVYRACKRMLLIRAASRLGEAKYLPGTNALTTRTKFAEDCASASMDQAGGSNGATPRYQAHARCVQPEAEEDCSRSFDAHYPEVTSSGMNPQDFLQYGRQDGRNRNPDPGSWVSVIDAEIRCLKKLSFQNEVALFVTHSPYGYLKPYVYHYVGSLRRYGISVVLIVATDVPFLAHEGSLEESTDGIFIRQNEGFDFAAWAHVLQLYPELFSASTLYLINDSLIGPTNEETFADLLRRLRNSPADLMGLTENFERGWHIQSYFLALKSRGLSSPVFQKFIADIVSYKNKEDVISDYEIRLAPTLNNAGLHCEVIFRAIDFQNLTTHHWKRLFQSGFPFMKTAVIRNMIPGVDTSDWREVLATSGFDVSLAEQVLAEERKTVQ
jgi:ADP-heptose:LPS heptosyltransferase/GT2 family glycosyltransferase